jgi:mannose-1-phosphate guanylyltransferase/phosphomannomutase
VRDLPEGYISSSIINLDGNGRVTTFLEKPAPEVFEKYKGQRNYINNGIYVLEPHVLSEIPGNTKYDFAKDLIPKLMTKKSVYGFVSNNFFREIGRIEKYEQFKKEFAGRALGASRAVFLDRDGVISRNVHDINTLDKFVMIDGAAEAVRKLNDAGFMIIVATNQPVIAKGLCTFETMEKIHEKMRRLLREGGAHVDAIYMCPHHPDKGFPGEVPELKIMCDCRKPKPGMLLRAMKEHDIDPKGSWMVGDSKIDVVAGQAAGVRTILLTSGGGSNSKDEKAIVSVRPDRTFYDLKEAAEFITKKAE